LPVRLLTLCTGNAARSVIAGAALLAELPDADVRTAGTFVIEGQPMSRRTRDAFDAVGLDVPSHRSAQTYLRDVEWADLVIAMAPEHVEWIRREHAVAAHKTATLHRLARDWPVTDAPFADKVASLALERVELEDWEEIADPGGNEAHVFEACAREIVDLTTAFVTRLRPPADAP
jgi:protein-tyrosine-phosphatase